MGNVETDLGVTRRTGLLIRDSHGRYAIVAAASTTTMEDVAADLALHGMTIVTLGPDDCVEQPVAYYSVANTRTALKNIPILPLTQRPSDHIHGVVDVYLPGDGRPARTVTR